MLDVSAERQVVNALRNPSNVIVLAVLEGVADVPGIEPPLQYVLDHVKPIEIPWLQEL